MDQVSEYMVKVVRDIDAGASVRDAAKNLDPNNTKISDILNLDIDYIDQEETMSRAIAIMREKRLRYLIVRDGKTVREFFR